MTLPRAAQLKPSLQQAAGRIAALWAGAHSRVRALSGTLWTSLEERRSRSRASSLITQLLTLQLVIVAAVGMLAIGGLYWTSRTVIDRNLDQWATHWARELNELGAPFYLGDKARAVLGVQRFVDKYPEISAVHWFGPKGAPMQSLNQGKAAALDSPTVARLAALVGKPDPYMLSDAGGSSLKFRLAGPIWSSRTAGANLLDLGKNGAAATEHRLLGFVVVDLDYSWYEKQFMPKLWFASIALVLLLGMSWIAGRRLIKRALAPLAALQAPLAQLARGDMQVQFPASEHSEIQSIVDALERTTVALHERDSRLVHLAMHDSLTGLYNRHRFVSELEEEIAAIGRRQHRSAVLFIDLDQFKYINDTCGHPAGDQLLTLAAACIGHAVRSTDIVARFGGDEFTVLLKNVTREQVQTVGVQILEQMRALIHRQDGKAFSLQCSIGAAEIDERTDPHELLAQADLACHVAKSKGRNRLEFYELAAHESRRMTKDVDWVKSVREALDTDRFTLYYQPLVDVTTGIADHYEALLRLQISEDRVVLPNLFMPAAARFGLLPDIDRWVVDRALASLSSLRESRPGLRFSINLSASVLDDEFIGYVRGKLEEYALPGDSVIFEVTEQEAVRFALQAARQMQGLRSLGCRFAVDDFGTGYSSFAYLKKLPVDFLKIDGSFIRDLERDAVDQTMVRVIGEVAKAAGLKTVAEYVQSDAAMRLLAEYGIDYGQGFHLGRPSETPQETLYAPAAAAKRSRKRKSTARS